MLLSPHFTLHYLPSPFPFLPAQTPPIKLPACSSKSYLNSSSSSSKLSYPKAEFAGITKGSVGSSLDSRITELVRALQLVNNVKHLRRAHGLLLKNPGESSVFVGNNLISSYVKLGKLIEARKVFEEMHERNVVSWTAMLNGYLRLGREEEVLTFFSAFLESGVLGNVKTYVCVLNSCSRRGDFVLGKQVHACVVKGGMRNLIVDSAVVYLYASRGDLASAFRAFHDMKERDVVCWTTMIAACAQRGKGGKALLLFSSMVRGRFAPNEFTVCSALKACGEEMSLKFGKQLHCAVVKKMYKDDVFVGTALVDMYAKCCEISDSRKVFDSMRKRNTVTWTSIIAGYARKGFGEEAVRLFRIMKRRKIFSNNLTIVSILMACGSIESLVTGREVHAQIIKHSIESNVYVESTLVWFYCKCGEYQTGFTVFRQMPLRDVVPWTAIISGYANLGHEPEALEFFKEMLGEGVEPNPSTYSSALKACANLEAIMEGKLIHSSLNKTPALANVFVGTALINMYAKCGCMSEAIQVFDSMPERNKVAWKAMIVAYARNGLCREALQLVYRMQAEGIEVDDYIVTTVLSACGDIDWNFKHSSEYCFNLLDLLLN